jgi:hypothetical protein
MAVEAGAQPRAPQDLAELTHVLDQPLGRHRGVLDERRRPRAALAGGHQQAEARLAHGGQRVLLGGRLGAQRVIAVAVLAPRPRQRVQLVAHLRLRGTREGHEQQRLGVALETVGELAVLELGAREVEDRAVDQLDRARLERERVVGGGDRGQQVVEVTDREHLGLRELHELDGGRGDDRQGPLGPHDQLREVERVHAVEPVAARLAPVPRVVLGDRARVLAQDALDAHVQPSLEGGPRDRVLRERGARAVAQDHLELEHVIDRRPVHDRLAAGGVVADHPADRGPVRRRGVRPEAEPVAPGRAVEVLLHDAGLDPHAPAVDGVDAVHVPRGVDHQPAAARGLAREARPAAARDHRHAVARGDRHRGRDIVRRAWEDDRAWLDRVQAGVGREQMARIGIRAHLPGQLPLERGRELLHEREIPAR